MSEPSPARVVHRSPGRLRVHLPSLTEVVHDRLRRVEATDGVRAARLSERTANVLVEFDQALIDEPSLLALIDGRPADRSIGRGRPAPVADPPVESGWLWAQRTETIKAKPAACIAAIIDFERYPEWQSYIAVVEVLERDERGRGVLVAARGEVGQREARFTVRYRFPSPNRVLFEQLDGELDAVRGG